MLITWDKYETGIYGKLIDASGNVFKSEFLVNEYTIELLEGDLKIIGLSNGNVLITWNY